MIAVGATVRASTRAPVARRALRGHVIEALSPDEARERAGCNPASDALYLVADGAERAWMWEREIVEVRP